MILLKERREGRFLVEEFYREVAVHGSKRKEVSRGSREGDEEVHRVVMVGGLKWWERWLDYVRGEVKW